jgi:hypothetical protein
VAWLPKAKWGPGGKGRVLLALSGAELSAAALRGSARGEGAGWRGNGKGPAAVRCAHAGLAQERLAVGEPGLDGRPRACTALLRWHRTAVDYLVRQGLGIGQGVG